MQDTLTGENVYLNCVITDKDVVLRDGRVLSGHETMPFYIRKGATRLSRPPAGKGGNRFTMKKILFVASEALPFASSGGLGDVIGSLPAAIARRIGGGLRRARRPAAVRHDGGKIPRRAYVRSKHYRRARVAEAVLRDFHLRPRRRDLLLCR